MHLYLVSKLELGLLVQHLNLTQTKFGKPKHIWKWYYSKLGSGSKGFPSGSGSVRSEYGILTLFNAELQISFVTSLAPASEHWIGMLQ